LSHHRVRQGQIVDASTVHCCYSFSMIQTFEHGAIRELRLNRPPVNAISAELIAALLQAVERAPREGERPRAFGLAGHVLGWARCATAPQARSAGNDCSLA
jgi:hypothetical protein